jgi:membrane-associated protease RseP (regulator of RpoE activity)
MVDEREGRSSRSICRVRQPPERLDAHRYRVGRAGRELSPGVRRVLGALHRRHAGLKPVVGDPPPATAAAYAGLANGDTVTSVADEPVATWNDVRWMLLKEAVKRGTTDLEVQTSRGTSATRHLDMSGLSKDDLDKDFLGKLGLRPSGRARPPCWARSSLGAPRSARGWYRAIA